MRFMMAAMIFLLLAGCQFVGESDEVLTAKIEEMKERLHEKDMEIYELERSLDDSRQTTMIFCSASRGRFWYDFVCPNIDDYPSEWRRIDPISWWAVARIVALPLTMLATAAGFFFMFSVVLAKDWFADKRIHEKQQYEKDVIANCDAVVLKKLAVIDEANRAEQRVDDLEKRECALMERLDELTERINASIDKLEELDAKIANRKAYLGDARTGDDNDDDSGLF